MSTVLALALWGVGAVTAALLFAQTWSRAHRPGGIDLTSYAKAIASTSRGGPIVTPGDPKASGVVRVLTDTTRVDGKLPYHARATQRVPQFDIDLIEAWVRDGARGPRTPTPVRR